MNIYFYYDVAKERITLQNTCSSGLICFSTSNKENGKREESQGKSRSGPLY